MNARNKELAEQAGYKPLLPPTFADELNEIFMQKFAELVRAEEREACAKLCEEKISYETGVMAKTGAVCARQIRARGEVR